MADSRASLILELKDFVSSQLDKVSGKMQTLKDSALKVAAAFATFSGIIYKSVTAAGEQERAVLRLNNALLSVPGTTAGASERLSRLASEMQKLTGIGDESIISMQAMLATFKLNEQAIAALTPRILDISARMGIDMTSAAMQLGKALQTGEIGMLNRMGISVDQAAVKYGNLETVIKSIDATFQGSAAVAGNSIIGSINKLKSAVGDAFEQIGFALDKYLRPFINGLTNLVTKFNESESSLKKWAAVALLAGVAITGLTAALIALGAVITPLSAGLAIVNSPISLIAAGLVTAAVATTALATNFGNLRTVVVNATKDIGTGISLVGAAVMSLLSGNFKEAMENGKKAAFAFADGTIGAFYEAKNGIAAQLDAIKSKLAEPLPAPQMPSGEGAQIFRTSSFDEEEFQKKILAIRGFTESVAQIEMESYAKQLEAQQQFNRARELRDTFSRQKSIDSAKSMFAALGSIQATKSEELMTIVKAANIATAIMDTYTGATKAMGQLGAWGFPVAAAIIAAGMANVATIAGVELAEGGIATARPGGIPAIIGEGGRDEAVIPLDDPKTQERLAGAFGGGPTIVIQAGTIVADEYSVTEFAKRIDKKLFEMGKTGRRLS